MPILIKKILIKEKGLWYVYIHEDSGEDNSNLWTTHTNFHLITRTEKIICQLLYFTEMNSKYFIHSGDIKVLNTILTACVTSVCQPQVRSSWIGGIYVDAIMLGGHAYYVG